MKQRDKLEEKSRHRKRAIGKMAKSQRQGNNPLRWNALYSNRGDIDEEEPIDEAEDAEDDLPDDQSQQMSFSTMDFSAKAPYQDETGDETE